MTISGHATLGTPRQGPQSVCSNRLCICTVTMAFTGLSRNLHILAGIFSIENLCLAGKTLKLLVGGMLVNVGDDILPETSMHAAIWVGIT